MPVREKCSEKPGGPVPSASHVPFAGQTAAKPRDFAYAARRFTGETDWLAEGAGFELLVLNQSSSAV
jgi:hypothetical protein